MTPLVYARYQKFAQEIMEPVLQMAGRRLEHVLEEVHATQIKPLKAAVKEALELLDSDCPNLAKDVLSKVLRETTA